MLQQALEDYWKSFEKFHWNLLKLWRVEVQLPFEDFEEVVELDCKLLKKCQAKEG